MNPFMLASFIIPAIVAFVLITLLIKERYNLFPKKTNTNASIYSQNESENDNRQTDNRINRVIQGKKYPDDFLDFSGGAMGI